MVEMYSYSIMNRNAGSADSNSTNSAVSHLMAPLLSFYHPVFVDWRIVTSLEDDVCQVDLWMHFTRVPDYYGHID